MVYLNEFFDIQDLLLNITNFCLGSCVYCNLHELNGYRFDDEISVKNIEDLLTDQYLDNLKNIHITGGEPILSPKLLEVCKLVKKYHPDIRANMPVSGFFPSTTFRHIKKVHQILPQLRVDISVDGYTKETHEKTRGRGSWKQLMQTIKMLFEIEGLQKQFQFSVMDSNYMEIEHVMDWAKSIGVGFYLCFPREGIRFGHKKDKSLPHNKTVVDCIDAQIKDTWCKVRPLNAQIWLAQKANWEGKKVWCNCNMGRYSIDVAPDGYVYPCMSYYDWQRFGNIKIQTLTDILESNQTKDVLDGIKKRLCQPCVMPVGPHKNSFEIDGECV